MSLLSGSTLTLYGAVGDIPDYGGDNFTAKQVRAALDKHGPGDITVNLNSGGGIAFEGLAIFNALKNHPGRIVVNVDAIAASAASLIAMAGDEISMRNGAMIMVHDPRAMTAGTAKEHRKSADRLDSLSDQFRRIYASRTGLSEKDVGTLMDAETWMDATKAIEFRFATDSDDSPALAAATFNYSAYAHAPQFLTASKGTPHMPLAIDDDKTPSEKSWSGKFFRAAESSGLALAELNAIVDAAATFDQAKDKLIDKLAEARSQLPKSGGNPDFRINGNTLDNPDFLGTQIENVLYARMSGKAPEAPAARELMGRSLLDLGAALLQSQGERVSWSNRDRLASRIMMSEGGKHSTSDFPILLTGAGQRILMDSYNAAQCPLKAIAKRRDAVDFRAITATRLSEAPRLSEVLEGGEITYGSRSESKESFRVKSYAKIFGLTRQAIINDDLGAFSDSATAWGRGAAETEAELLVALFTANTGNGANLDDGNPLYTTGRKNKATTGTVIDVANLGLARQAMREMKGLDGKTPIGVTPKHLIVGPAKETEAEQVLAAIAAAQTSDVNPFSGKLTLHVEPRFTGNAWRLFCDPAELATIIIAYLNGVNGPVLSTRDGWNVLGTEFRAVLDFGCGVVEHRGTHLNTGN